MLKIICLLLLVLSIGVIDGMELPNHQTPNLLYKILTKEEWDKIKGKVTEEKLPRIKGDQKFIHLSMKDQIPKVVAKYYQGANFLVLLALKTDELEGDLIYEANPGGTTKYYHLYANGIPTKAIQSVEILDIVP